MHIPDGCLGPQTYLPLYGVSIGFWAIAQKKLKKQLSLKHVPYLAMAAAFSFLIMMFNIPIPGGTTGRAVGSAIIAILLEPWTAVLAVSVVLIIQALLFGDGGITSAAGEVNYFNGRHGDDPYSVLFGTYRPIAGMILWEAGLEIGMNKAALGFRLTTGLTRLFEL